MDIANFLLNLLILVIVGYQLFVKLDTSEKRVSAIKQIKRKMRHEKLGAIEKLTPEQVNKVGTRLEQTERAIEETLDDLL